MSGLLPPANEVWGKVIFSEACVKNFVHRGACVVAGGGACMVAGGGGVRGCRGHAWLWRACVVAGVCVWLWGCAWLLGGCVWLQGVCAWLQGGMHG